MSGCRYVRVNDISIDLSPIANRLELELAAEAWLRHYPSIQIIARDRGGGYGEAAAKALPNALQVADRWHLMENASRTFLDTVRKSMRPCARSDR